MKRLIVLSAFCMIVSCKKRDFNAAESSTQSQKAEMTCGGTEPFWSLTVNKSGIYYKQATFSSVYKVVAPQTFETNTMNPEDLGSIYRSKDAKNNEILFVVRKESCDDMMGDSSEPYSVRVFDSNGAYRGCCRM